MVLIVSWIGNNLVVALTSKPKGFSYKLMDAPADSASMQTALNEYGQAGWELVSVEMGDMTIPRLIFKKQP
jgi:hypothetical protein